MTNGALDTELGDQLAGSAADGDARTDTGASPHRPPFDGETDVESTVHALRAAATHVELLLARALEPHHLTATQYFVLQVMDEVKDEELRCSELGRRLVGPAPDVTRLLDRLESVGLVSRERDKNDRRAVHSKLTPLGLETLNKARPDVRLAEKQALADLCPSSRQQLASLLGDVRRRCPGN